MPALDLRRPRAITMWDISWLLRRWPGAGFEDWDKALDELVERGYDAVRLEAFPHLLSVDPDAEWEFIAGADCHDWAAPLPVKARPWPALGRRPLRSSRPAPYLRPSRRSAAARFPAGVCGRGGEPSV